MRVVAVSGGFDPIQVGHIYYFEQAKKLGDRLIVILNNDNWLRAKKGYVFMPAIERLRIIEALKPVDMVLVTGHKPNDPDKSVCTELRNIRPEIFANGGDRFSDNIPEKKLCEELGIEMVFNVGGEKVQSSSALVNNAMKQLRGEKE
jgi:D-beta-D-heptose 7-phosphate kinase/D-beta-D-heptose 1-phosphate adenosyltransferase